MEPNLESNLFHAASNSTFQSVAVLELCRLQGEILAR